MDRQLGRWVLGRVNGKEAKDQRRAVLNTCGECGVARAFHPLWIGERLERWVRDKLRRTWRVQDGFCQGRDLTSCALHITFPGGVSKRGEKGEVRGKRQVRSSF